jgi:ABC-type transporter Mla subunit MlaD
MLGIKVGQIESVSIDPKDFTRVRVGLALHPGTPITMSTTALVQRNLLTGLGMIDLVGSSPTSRLNGGGLRNDDIPEIQEGIPQLIQLQRSLPVILEHVDKVLTSTSDVLNEGNREKIARVIENLEKISGGLADSGGALKEGTREISVAIHGFLSQLDERTKKITDAFSRTSGDMSRQVGTVSGTLSDTLRAIARLVEELEHPRRLLLGPSPKDLGPGETRP